MRDNASFNADSGGNFMQRNAQLGAERHTSMRAGEESHSRRGDPGNAGTETIHYPADEGIRRNKALSPQLAEGHMNGRLILADPA